MHTKGKEEEEEEEEQEEEAERDMNVRSTYAHSQLSRLTVGCVMMAQTARQPSFIYT